MSAPAVPEFERLEAGQELPVRVFETSTIQLFLYNAALWNAHRIHFDEPYARGAEGYPALVMAGPQLGDWLHQCVIEWLGDSGGRLLSMEYSNRRAAYVGDTLRSVGSIAAIDRERRQVTIDVAILNQKDEVLAPGRAIASLP